MAVIFFMACLLLWTRNNLLEKIRTKYELLYENLYTIEKCIGLLLDLVLKCFFMVFNYFSTSRHIFFQILPGVFEKGSETRPIHRGQSIKLIFWLWNHILYPVEISLYLIIFLVDPSEWDILFDVRY